MKNMKGGVAVVTGGGSGLGKAMALEAARRDAACFSRVVTNAAGEEKRRFLSSFKTNSTAKRSS